MASVHEHHEPRTEATRSPSGDGPVRSLSANELETARQAERDNGLRILGAITAVVVGLLCIGLWRMGGPRVEDPLPVPPTASTTGIARDAWKRCDVTGLHIECVSPSGNGLSLDLSSQDTVRNLCAVLPCVFPSVGVAGNGNCTPECLRARGVTTTSTP